MSIRDTHLCQQGLIHKAGRTNYLFNLYAGNKEAIDTYEFSVERMKTFGVCLSSDKLFYSPVHNATSMTIKCGDNDEIRRVNVDQASIISILPGCTLTTNEFLSKHTKEFYSESMNPQMTSYPGSEIFSLLEQNCLSAELMKVIFLIF